MVNTWDKPLPAIPKQTLSADAVVHIRRFIQAAISEGEAGLMSQYEQHCWVDALQDALDSLGNCIVAHNWLFGLRMAKISTKIRTDAFNLQLSREKTQSSEEGKRKANVSKNAYFDGPVDPGRRNVGLEDEGLPATDRRRPGKRDALAQIRNLIHRPDVADPTPFSAKHLLLCVLPYSERFLRSNHDSPHLSYHVRPNEASIYCQFHPGDFSILEKNSEGDSLLYGLDQWDDVSTYRYGIAIVGGTFSFTGTASAAQHAHLEKTLTVVVYAYLSLLLETCALLDSDAEVIFPRSPPLSPPSSLPSSSPSTSPPGRTIQGHHFAASPKLPGRRSMIPSGVLSFFSRKTESLLHRVTPTPSSIANMAITTWTSPKPPRPSLTLSLGEHAQSVERPRIDALVDSDNSSYETDRHFTSIFKRISDYKGLLSTSPGVSVSLAPPPLISLLAEKERVDPTRLLEGNEKAGLRSLLGWEGKEGRAKGMTGLVGFIRHQEISFLYSEHVLQEDPDTSSTTEESPIKPSSITTPSTKLCLRSCQRPRWITLLYHSRWADKALGDAIIDWCNSVEEPCESVGCRTKRGGHEMRWHHGSIRVTISLGSSEDIDGSDPDDDGIYMSARCRICSSKTDRRLMSHGTFLMSFAKYLELLIYSPALCAITSNSCEHIAALPEPPRQDDSLLPRSRFNIRRSFTFQTHVVNLELSTIDNIFELRLPLLQVVRSKNSDQLLTPQGISTSASVDPEAEKQALKREIKLWWQSIEEHIDKLKGNIGDNFHEERLLHLPSDEETLETYDTTVNLMLKDQTSWKFVQNQDASRSHNNDTIHSLASMNRSFQRLEQNLYAQLSQTPSSRLNDVRHSFLAVARGASKRLNAWQAKYRPDSVQEGKTSLGVLTAGQPLWWSKGCYAVPGSNLIIHEDDWGSIIAFTLSCTEFQSELLGMSFTPGGNSANKELHQTASTESSNPSAILSAASRLNFFRSNSALPDPDQEGPIWHEPEPFSTSISRHENPKDYNSLLSLRDVLRHRVPVDASGAATPYKSEAGKSSVSRAVSGASSASVWAKPAVEISRELAGGEVIGPQESVDSAETFLQALEGAAPSGSTTSSSLSSSVVSTSEPIQSHIHRGKTSSIISNRSDSTINADAMSYNVPPVPPPKDDELSNVSGPLNIPDTSSEQMTSTASSFTRITDTISHAMRYFVTISDEDNQLPPSAEIQIKHSLLSTDPSGIDERPHIKYDFTIGRRKFSCTAYFAKQFDILRRKCGIEAIFVRSLSRSSNWTTDGGKSKSNFWKTSDDRFIIKTLVNAWNVADLQVLLDLAPSYFRYVETTAGRTTILAKWLGVYTVEVKNVENGSTHSKADLLVMENLFYNRDITKAFDLKGIRERKMKAGDGNTHHRVLLDGDWIEGQERDLNMIRLDSKFALREAIKSDGDFLCKSNIMDYSLLVGVENERKQITCGLVDTIGSYTFAKTLEYKAKQGLKGRKSVTVIPPAEYRARLADAVESYLVVCPDKWSCGPIISADQVSSIHSMRRAGDWKALPSVL